MSAVQMCLPFQRGSATSRAAAMAAVSTAQTARAKVLHFVESRGEWGATRDEIARGLEIKIQTVCARVDDLLRLGFIRRTTETRKTDTGRAAEVILGALRDARSMELSNRPTGAPLPRSPGME